jgi:pimeloyl-ACP methyl ester carboxylesterase
MSEDRYGIFSINNNPNSDFDVIFIHGLGGDKNTTWQNKNGESWQNWLAEDYNASIWTIGYGANKTNWIEEDMSLDNAAEYFLGSLKSKGIGNKPYMFVVHSMGGLLVKKILLKAYIHDEYKELPNMCKSIVFFAVPHTGSGWANLFKYGKILLRSSHVIKALARNISELHELSSEFDALVVQKKIETFIFYEQKQVRSPKLFSWLHLRKGINIVSRESATHIHSTNQKVPLPEDHISICKINSKTSDTYATRMKMIMNKMIEIQRSENQDRSTPQALSDNVGKDAMANVKINNGNIMRDNHGIMNFN